MGSAVHHVTHAFHKVIHGIEHVGKEIIHHPLETVGLAAAAYTGGMSLGLFGGGASAAEATGISMADTAIGASTAYGGASAVSAGLTTSGLLSAVDTGGKILGGVGTLASLTRKTPQISMPAAPAQPQEQPSAAGTINTGMSLGAGIDNMFGITKTKYSSKKKAPTTRYGLGAFLGIR